MSLKLTLVSSLVKIPGAGSIATMTYRNEGLDWNVKAFDRNRQKVNNLGYEAEVEVVDPFDQLNAYWASLPEAKQELIFQAYKEAFDVFENSEGLSALMTGLSPLIQRLIDLHKYEEVNHWVRMYSTIGIPKDARVYQTLAENVQKGEQFGSQEWPRESTYLIDDYWGLIVLILTLRALYPIWGRFMSTITDDIDTTLKEFYAFKMLSKTSLMKADNFKKLEAYVRHYVPQEKVKNSAVAGYVSTEDFVSWMFGLVLVRRLSLLKFDGSNPQFSLVSSIWSFINQTMKGYEKTVNETIKPKNPEGGQASKDKSNKASNLELVKIKEKITNGDVVALNFFAGNTALLAEIRCPQVPPELLIDSMAIVARLESTMLQQPQVTLLQWVIAPVLPPRSIDHLEKKEVLSAMAVAFALLWHKKYYDLAALLTASVEDNTNVMKMGGVESRTRISKENQERLLELYPHLPEPSSRRTEDKDKSVKKICTAFKSIELLQAGFSNPSWLLNLPKSWYSMVPNHLGRRRYSVPADIRNKLAEIAIAIATKTL